MDPMILIVCLSLGMAALFGVMALRNGRRATCEDKVMKGYFLLGLSGLMAKIAQADGQVTADETELAQRFFSNMNLTDAEKALCIGNFVTARRDGLEARDHVKRFMAYANAVACAFLYDLLWRIAFADGRLTEDEDRLMRLLATYLGLGEKAYGDFKAGRKPVYDRVKLGAAGVPDAFLSLVG